MLKQKKAFTLAEVAIAIVTLGVLAAFLLPALQKIKPNKNKLMFKKAYSDTERTVDLLISDETLYPVVIQMISETAQEKGLYNTESVLYNGKTYTGANKFCNLFAQMLNTSNINCDNGAVAVGNAKITVPSFVTTNGVAWYVSKTAFSSGTIKGTDEDYTTIVVDVNGVGKSPDCIYKADTCKEPDTFQIYIRNDGKIKVSETKEVEYLQDMSNAH